MGHGPSLMGTTTNSLIATSSLGTVGGGMTKFTVSKIGECKPIERAVEAQHIHDDHETREIQYLEDKIVEVPIERVVEHIVEVPEIQTVEKVIEDIIEVFCSVWAARNNFVQTHRRWLILHMRNSYT